VAEVGVQGRGNVLVVGEAGANGSERPVSWEMLAAARQIANELDGGNVTGLFIGAGIAARIAPVWKVGHGMIIGLLFLLSSIGQMSTVL